MIFVSNIVSSAFLTLAASKQPSFDIAGNRAFSVRLVTSRSSVPRWSRICSAAASGSSSILVIAFVSARLKPSAASVFSSAHSLLVA